MSADPVDPRIPPPVVEEATRELWAKAHDGQPPLPDDPEWLSILAFFNSIWRAEIEYRLKTGRSGF